MYSGVVEAIRSDEDSDEVDSGPFLEETLVQLFRRERIHLLRFASKIIGNHAEAEDIVSGVIIKLVNSWDSIEDTSYESVCRWAFTATRYSALNSYTRRRAWSQVALELAETESDADHNDPHRALMVKEHAEMVNRLDVEYREPVIMKGLGHRGSEIAEALDITDDNVHKRISRARKRLGRCEIDSNTFKYS